MGAFLAGTNPGFELLTESGSDALDYPKEAGAQFTDMGDHLVDIEWRRTRRKVYYQGGPSFKAGAASHVIATYTNGQPAALIAPFGKGFVGVVGPHPEAPESWMVDSKLEINVAFDLFNDLVQATLHGDPLYHNKD
jgi:glutamine amidotransferase-like uncharacterized protein